MEMLIALIYTIGVIALCFIVYAFGTGVIKVRKVGPNLLLEGISKIEKDKQVQKMMLNLVDRRSLMVFSFIYGDYRYTKWWGDADGYDKYPMKEGISGNKIEISEEEYYTALKELAYSV